jgi:hypothetical protein
LLLLVSKPVPLDLGVGAVSLPLLLLLVSKPVPLDLGVGAVSLPLHRFLLVPIQSVFLDLGSIP